MQETTDQPIVCMIMESFIKNVGCLKTYYPEVVWLHKW